MEQIKRSKKENPYVILDKTCLNDKELSWQAKGLHSYIMGLPEDWKLFLSDLENRSSDKRDCTANCLNELIAYGYAQRVRLYAERGRFAGYDYTIYESAQAEIREKELPLYLGKLSKRNQKAAENKAKRESKKGFTENGISVFGKSKNGEHDTNEETNNKIMKEVNNKENKIVVTDTPSFPSEDSNLSLEQKKESNPPSSARPPSLKGNGSESPTKVVLAHFDKLILQLGISYTYPKSAAGWKPIHTCCKQIHSEVGADGLNDFFAKIESMCASEIFPFKDKSAITPIFIGSVKVVGIITNYEMVGTTFDAKTFFKLKAEDGIAWRKLHKHLLDCGYTNILHNNEIVNMAKGGVPCEDGLPKTFDSITFKKLRETSPQRANYYAATRQQQ